MYGKIISMQKVYCNTKVERNNRKVNNDRYFRIVELQVLFSLVYFKFSVICLKCFKDSILISCAL